ncbi:MAG: MaoC family dehydratase N-terminal domain-containing protein [Chloroflexi bacterium]|nr:MaoC family dehydratase N-terminal domain-containing protein [Chloroflexota bacterium]
MSDRFYEDLRVGEKVLTMRRPITEPDLVTYCQLTWNPDPLHNDKEWCLANTPFKERLVPGPMTLGMTSGLESQTGLLENAIIGQLGLQIKFLHGVFPGDTIQAEIEVVEKRETSKPDRGLAMIKNTVRNQDGVAVAEFLRTFLVRRRPQS